MPFLSQLPLFCAAPVMSDVRGGVQNVVSNRNSLRAVKVCGITSARDAELVASIARSELPSHIHLLLGMLLWKGSRRSVTPDEAKAIASIANDAGATSVGVFVDEDIPTISSICASCNISVAQLHGPLSRTHWRNASTVSLPWIDVRDVSPDGFVSTATERVMENDLYPSPIWTIFDAKGGGTGQPFDWTKFTPPSSDSWMLAGGLCPENVAEAIHSLRPVGLDVATGVAGPDKLQKDRHRVRQFLQQAIDAYY